MSDALQLTTDLEDSAAANASDYINGMAQSFSHQAMASKHSAASISQNHLGANCLQDMG